MIQVDRLTKLYGTQAVLRGVSLTVPAGTILTVLGPNGSGKTTLLRLLATLARPSAGSGAVGGRDLVREREAVRRLTALVAHETQLYDDLTASENLAFAAALRGAPADATRRREALALVGLEAHADTRVRALSSGMRRRVALARAVLQAPRVLLLDEPFAGLDGDGAKRLEGYLHGFRADGGTAVVVTHGLDRALALADAVVVLAAGRVAGRQAGPDLTEAAVQRLYLAAAGTE
jgi:heme ABC exporter ATP-binding subunit CcmA